MPGFDTTRPLVSDSLRNQTKDLSMNRHYIFGRLGLWLVALCLFASGMISVTEVSAIWWGPKPVLEAPKWGMFETAFKSAIDYDNPLGDVTLTVVFTSPLGDTHTVYGFWDGGKNWRVRFSPDFPGKWRFRTVCSDAANNSLNDVTGEFVCIAAENQSAFTRRGPVQVARDHRHLEYADHSSFFWLADNAGPGALWSTPAQWNFYAQVRAQENFTAAQWIASPGSDAAQRSAFSGSNQIKINLDFFKAMDAKVAALNRAGILNVIVPFAETGVPGANATASHDNALTNIGSNATFSVTASGNTLAYQWMLKPVVTNAAASPDSQSIQATNATFSVTASGSAPFTYQWYFNGAATNAAALPDSQTIILLRYMVARWGANDVAWLLPCGDGQAERWKKIGRAVFGGLSHAPVILEPGGTFSTAEAFRNERWVDIFGYQNVRDVTEDWKKYPPRPYINFTAAYENEPAGPGQPRVGADDLRHTAGWSLLATPTSGIGYGAHGVWNWDTTTNTPTPDTQPLAAWQIDLYLAGAKQLGTLAGIFKTIDFGGLRPAPDLVVSQSSAHPVAAALTEFGDLALVYLPEGGDVELHRKPLPLSPKAAWINARTGERSTVGMTTDSETCKFSAPGAGDWFLLIQSGKK